MKTLFKLLVLVVVLAVAGAAFFVFAPAGPGAQKFVLIKPGSSTRAIARQLAQAGVVRNEYALLALHVVKGRPSLKAGEYAFDRAATAAEVHERLVRGDVFFHTVVIPEGYNIFDIAAELEKSGLVKKADFVEVAQREKALIADLDPQAPSLEGYLFPDSYHFSRTQSAKDIAAMMVKRFREEATALGLISNLHRTVTLASIIEKETSVASERPLVAGVFENRLAQRIGLATDPSVIYAALL
ncbi:MAG TPA: endolytic transglycosylase MltG, partial [Terriglobales bacterium]|nr:endolytic transglycosylase MltG [Terriglobales bacterium]